MPHREREVTTPGAATDRRSARDPVRALEADRSALLEICGAVDGPEWEAESGCSGWTVKDVVSHMGALFWSVVDPSSLPDTAGMPTERAQEALVEARRVMSPREVVEDYATVSQEAIEALAGLVAADFELELGDLGTYPARVIPLAFCFDHYVHIRCDLVRPGGPLPAKAPASDELRVGPMLDWVEAALPQQNRQLLDRLAGPVELVVSGTGSRTIRLGSDGAILATVRSDADAFVRWITQRGDWEALGVQASGDPGVLAEIRRLKVF